MITVSDFVRETWEDYKSPTTSTFASRMTHCRQTVNGLEEALDMDRSGLTKMKKSVKALYNSGLSHVSNEAYLAENFENLGNMAKTKEQEAEIHTAFVRFSCVTRELSILMKTMMGHLNSIVLHPLDTFLKSHLKGVKGDLKKPFDKAWKDYDSKFTKIEKEKKQQAKEAGMVRTDVSGAEIAEDLEKERKVFQLHMCEYLIKVNDIRTKKGVDLLKNLMEFYKAQTNFFQEGLKTISHYQTFIEELNQKVAEVKLRQDNERKQLVELRDALKSSMASYKEQAHNRLSGGGWPACQASAGGYSLHQLQGNKMHGCERSGYLLKKSEGRMRRVWQKRKCIIKDGFMLISHSDETKPPVKLNLLTCQVKLVQDDPGRKCFDLISSLNNRTYHFQSDDEKDMDEWISVLNNAREEVLMKAFTDSSSSPSLNQSVRELTTSIIDHIRRLPGNKHCCDCGAADPEWLSVNLGVLICLECCGIHRDLGVHISRTQSMVIDDLGTSQLLLARIVSNKNFNEIMEATLPPDQKPKPNSNMNERKEFIRAKYLAHKYAIITCTERYDLMQDLKMAVNSLDVLSLLQVFAEGADLMSILPDTELEETALHLAVREDHGNALPVIDFIAQNSAIGSLDQKNRDGNTALHLCAELNRVEAMKLLLRVRPDLANVKNKEDKTALDIAKDLGHTMCQELLKAALTGKKDLYEHINIDWDLIQDDQDFGDSDDDLDSTPDRQKPKSRPPSLIVNLEGALLTSKESLASRERLDSDSKPPPPPPPSQGKPKKLHSYPIKYRNNKLGKTGTGLGLQSNHSSNDNLNGGNNGGVGPAESSESLPPIPPRGKKPPPPPPSATMGGGHSRNRSEPDISFLTAHKRTSSDPPPRPQPPDIRNTIAVPSGLKSAFTVVSHEGSDPRPFQHPRTSLIRDDIGSAIRTHSLGRSESQPESCSDMDTPPPIPEPRTKGRKPPAGRRCKALFDCDADNDDELTFKEGEIIIAIREEEDEWWEGQVEGDPKRRGLFPVSWVRVLD